MAVVSFWGNNNKETGQTLSMIAVSTIMAIEHNLKILAVSTGFNEKTIDESFWPAEKQSNLQQMLGISDSSSATISGVEGLSMIVQSNRTGNGIVGNYTKPVFNDRRLDILEPPETSNPTKYKELANNYPAIIKMASSDYNFVFVDIDKRMPQDIQKSILMVSDVIIVSTIQGKNSINNFVKLKQTEPMFTGNNIMLLLGKYNPDSKYNVKNIERYLKGKNYVTAIAYNTLFSESATEGTVVDYFLKFRKLSNISDNNYKFINEGKNTCDTIIYKLQELQKR